MNSLGLEYASDDENDLISRPPTSTHSVAASQSVIDSSNAKELADSSQDRPNLVHAPTKASAPASSDAPFNAEDEEALLLQAGIPPAVTSQTGNCDVQHRIERFLRVQRERGQDFQTTLQDKKEVRNPYILEKVVEYFGIDELQSNFASDVFDPHGLPLHEFADVLALEQKKRADARAHRQLQQQGGADPRKIRFVSS
ncbi:hypothetical protein CCR75_001317 [Bremia lactucae]|uniref:Uncharacterized protein n=1 Tax=Bremia lactucae TaxID=4779 RepID=A0A976FG63_BRELC|nr:hypothetical protein CCR75_001317 [Bremia lactucae]